MDFPSYYPEVGFDEGQKSYSSCFFRRRGKIRKLKLSVQFIAEGFPNKSRIA